MKFVFQKETTLFYLNIFSITINLMNEDQKWFWFKNGSYMNESLTFDRAAVP
jgi:hypothetical protein